MDLEILFEYQHHQDYNEGAIPVHRHRWFINVVLDGTDDQLHWLRSSFKATVNQALDPYQHMILNDVFPFNQIRPTHENIAKYLFNILDDTLVRMQCRLTNISITEDLDLISYIDHRCQEIDQLLTAASASITEQSILKHPRLTDHGTESRPRLASLAIGVPNVI